MAAEIMAGCGFDWLTIDAEHSLFDLNTIADTFRAIEARDCVPFVRAWDHDPVTKARILDAGAYGIIAPHVSTPVQAAAIADAMRYPPVGTRSSGTGRASALPDYRATIDSQVLVIPQIENIEGVENAEAILAVEGVDVGFLGPNDLALSMGVEPGHPDHEAAIQMVLQAGIKTGKPVGLPVRDVEGVKRRLVEGFRFLDCASDLRLLQVGAVDILAELG